MDNRASITELQILSMSIDVNMYNEELYLYPVCRYRVPKIIAMVITSLQLVQMIIGCAVNYIAFSYKQNGKITIELEGKRKDRNKELELVDI